MEEILTGPQETTRRFGMPATSLGRNKRLAAFSLMVLVIAATVQGATPSAPLCFEKPPRIQLELSTSILKQEYCESGGMRLKLRFRFTNSGMEPIILYRYSLAVTTEMFSRTHKDAMNGRYFEKLEPLVDPILPEPKDTATPDERLLVILEPGKSYETDQGSYMLGLTNATSDSLLLGDYYLRVTVPTWWWGEEKGLSLRNRWQSVGFLWTRDLTSGPMLIRVEKTAKTVKCSG